MKVLRQHIKPLAKVLFARDGKRVKVKGEGQNTEPFPFPPPLSSEETPPSPFTFTLSPLPFTLYPLNLKAELRAADAPESGVRCHL
ncbi:hypothetical protein NSTCB13_00918 [Nostoc sp. DSM 114160]|jgi:hypothetical protein